METCSFPLIVCRHLSASFVKVLTLQMFWEKEKLKKAESMMLSCGVLVQSAIRALVYIKLKKGNE